MPSPFPMPGKSWGHSAHKAVVECARPRLLAFLLVLAAVLSHAQSRDKSANSGINPLDPKLDIRVESLLQKMTLEEKIGQLVRYSAFSRECSKREGSSFLP